MPCPCCSCMNTLFFCTVAAAQGISLFCLLSDNLGGKGICGNAGRNLWNACPCCALPCLLYCFAFEWSIVVPAVAAAGARAPEPCTAASAIGPRACASPAPRLPAPHVRQHARARATRVAAPMAGLTQSDVSMSSYLIHYSDVTCCIDYSFSSILSSLPISSFVQAAEIAVLIGVIDSMQKQMSRVIKKARI